MWGGLFLLVGSCSDWRVCWVGGRSPRVPGAMAQLDLKCAWKAKPLPGELPERQVRKQPNTCQTSPADIGARQLPPPPRLGVYCFHMCYVFLCLFRLCSGWRCTAPSRRWGAAKDPRAERVVLWRPQQDVGENRAQKAAVSAPAGGPVAPETTFQFTPLHKLVYALLPTGLWGP